jgi:hypothetical protein
LSVRLESHEVNDEDTQRELNSPAYRSRREKALPRLWPGILSRGSCGRRWLNPELFSDELAEGVGDFHVSRNGSDLPGGRILVEIVTPGVPSESATGLRQFTDERGALHTAIAKVRRDELRARGMAGWSRSTNR